jgi:hypothetical protein
MRSWMLGAIAIAVAAAVSGTGCAAPRKKEVARDVQLLTAAGFRQIPADNAERAAALERLEPGQVVPVIHRDRTFYVYPDPKVCACLYVGRPDEYDAYLRILKQRANPEPAPLPWNADRYSNGSALLNPGIWGGWDWWGEAAPRAEE